MCVELDQISQSHVEKTTVRPKEERSSGYIGNRGCYFGHSQRVITLHVGLPVILPCAMVSYRPFDSSSMLDVGKSDHNAGISGA